MKGIVVVVFGSQISLVRAMYVALAMIAWSGNGACLGRSNSRVSAFCGSSIGRRLSRRTSPSLSAGRDSERNEWISKLEEEFHRSGNSEGHSNNPDTHRFQTSVQTITNAVDLLDQIDKAPPNDLTIVLFFAHYCKTCQRAFVPYKQLANAASNNTRFVRFETSSLTPKQFRSMGIDRVPFLQIYRNGICVSSFSATQKISRTSSKIVLRHRLAEQIEAYQTRSLTQWSAFRDQNDREIQANKVARAKIRAAMVSPQNAMNSSGEDQDDDEEEKLYRCVRTLTSESEFLYLLKESSRDQDEMVAIMFHSHFDPSCVRAQHKFRKIASERQQKTQKKQPFTMARIEASILSDKTLESLGIQKYPHIQIYCHSSDTSTTKQCVASFSIPRSFLFAKLLHESLDAIDQRTPEEWDAFYHRHKNDIESQQLALETILREREQ